MKKHRAGTVAEGRIAILDSDLNMRGQCGPKMTEASMSRFGLKHGATLKTIDGKKCWVGRKKS